TSYLFFFQYTAPTQYHTLSLHDALPIWKEGFLQPVNTLGDFISGGHLERFGDKNGHLGQYSLKQADPRAIFAQNSGSSCNGMNRSEEHTSELQSRENLVCRLLLEKKKTV